VELLSSFMWKETVLTGPRRAVRVVMAEKTRRFPSMLEKAKKSARLK
jgi:hypothetical protein